MSFRIIDPGHYNWKNLYDFSKKILDDLEPSTILSTSRVYCMHINSLCIKYKTVEVSFI